MVSLDEWQHRGAERRLLGRRIFVIDERASSAKGDAGGTPILCLHGFPSASWDWSVIWDALRASHRVLAFDFLGFGLSEKPPGHRYSIGEQADVAEAVVAEAGIDRYHVVAHDYGDTVAQELLARHNAKPTPGWRSLSLLNGGLFPETHRARRVQKLLAGPFGPLIARMMSRRALARSLTAIFGPQTPPSAHDIDVLWALLEREQGTRALPSLLGYIRERREHRERWVGALLESRVPRFRAVVGPSAAKIVELGGIGHYPQIEAPASVAAEILAFVEAI